MRNRLAIIAVAPAFALLAVPAVAPAKEVSEVRVCGAAGACTTYDKSDFKDLTLLASDAGPTEPPAAAAPWYRVRFTVDERGHGGGFARWTVAYVPSAGSLRVDDGVGGIAWVAVTPRARAAFYRAARHLPALPKAQLAGLDVKPPHARVHKVVEPPPTAGRAAVDASTSPWGWIVGAALAALVPATVLRRRRRAQSDASRRSSAAGPGRQPTMRAQNRMP